MLDLITTSLESFLISYSVNYFCNDKKIDKKNLGIGFVLLAIIQSNVFQRILNDLWMQIFSCVLLTFIIMIIMYKDTLLRAVTVVAVILLSLLSITLLAQENLYAFIKDCAHIDVSFATIWIGALFIRWTNAILQLKYIDVMCNFYETIIQEGRYLVFFLVILDMVAILGICTFNSIYGINSDVLKNILLLVFFILLIFILIYIIKVSEKSNEIHKLNSELEFNNNNLRKIKHDYGAQISYLYGLCLMKRFDDLKVSLKDIIEKSKFTSSIAISAPNSIISLAIRQAVENEDIKIEIKERAKLYLIDMPEMDLYRVIYNIAHNAVEAMPGEGNITAESYEKDNQVIILIQNDGPKIPDRVLRRIFHTGFTTKDNSEKGHGYGLSIVKELVEKYNGKITVKSSKELTEFRLTFEVSEKNI